MEGGSCVKVLSDKAQNKVICVFLLIGSIGLVVYGVTHIFSSIESVSYTHLDK